MLSTSCDVEENELHSKGKIIHSIYKNEINE